MTKPAVTKSSTEAVEVTSAGCVAASAEHDCLALPVGTRVDEFVVTGLVGIGGFGIVYRAHDEALDRTVALKEYMPSTLALRQAGNTVSAKSTRSADLFLTGLKSFVNEARMLALFDHPALVKVYRFWEANGTAYMVMPFYQGQTLQKTLAQMPEPPSEDWLRQLLHPLLEALEIIHAQHCLHRDIAPDNIFMLTNGQPVLLDFGAARQVIGDMAGNLTVILKPGFAPIEQHAGDPNLPQGPWTDIYALGGVLHLAITGQAPCPSVSRLLTDKYEPLAKRYAQSYTQPFLQAIDKALRVRPGDRPQDISELRQQFSLIPKVAESVPTTTPAERSLPDEKPARRARLPLLWIGVATVVVFGAVGYFLSGLRSQPAATAPAMIALPTTKVPDTASATAMPAAAPPASALPPGSAAVTPASKAASTVAKPKALPHIVSPLKPEPLAAAKSQAAMSASPADQSEGQSTPQWLREMRRELAVCNEQGFVARIFCIDQARRKHCGPAHWGEVKECDVSKSHSGD